MTAGKAGLIILQMRGIVSKLLLLIGFWLIIFPLTAHSQANRFNELRNRLAADGFNHEKIDSLYEHPTVRFASRSVSLFFMHSESRLNYGQFETPGSIRNARRYQQTHAESLARTEAKFGVAKEVITAIILVETRLGERLGNSSVLNTLSTMAALKSDQARQQLWASLPTDRRLPRQRFESKADKKSGWAYNELKAFLRYAFSSGIDPTIIRGSYAGAMGICQFMPSNIARLAFDGNGDGRIDLFIHEDAIASVANYLRHHGWKKGQSYEKAFKVIRRYNNSQPYAKTILNVAKELANT